MSRPKQKIIKDKIFKIRFSENELDVLKNASKELNKPISKIIREALNKSGVNLND